MAIPPSTSETILASARSFIVSGGYNAFSYADLAEVVGIRKASIHHHFPGKVDLVRTLVQQYRENAEVGLAELSAAVPDPLEQLRAYAGNWARCIEDASLPFCVCALLAAELPVLPSQVALEVRAYFRVLSSWLAEVMELGARTGRLAVETAAAPVEAEIFMATVHGAMLSARAQADPALFAGIVQPTLRRLAASAS
jgi:TetR/AcrR family transcriptional regulator, transcriptional repressor for nem operon